MSETLVKELDELRAKQRKEWLKKAAPSSFIFSGFHTALRLFIEKGSIDATQLDIEFAEELLELNTCLRNALIREGEPLNDDIQHMEDALNHHITLLNANR